MRSLSKYSLVPRPSQSGHAPNGLLKENNLGSISSIVKPDTGQANLAEKMNCSAVSAFSAISNPSDRSRTVSIESANLASRPSRTTTRSTTTSISCLMFLSKVGVSFKS